MIFYSFSYAYPTFPFSSLRTLALLNEAKKTVNFKVTTGEAGGPSRLGMTAVAGSLMGLGGALASSLAVFAVEGAVSWWKKRAKKRVHLG